MSDSPPPDAKRQKLEDPYVIDAKEAITLYLVSGSTASEVKQAVESPDCLPSWHPEFAHQHFGEEETIKGYKDLRISIFIHSQTIHTFIDYTFGEKRSDGEVSDVAAVLGSSFPAGLCKNADDFAAASTAQPPPDLAALCELSSSRVTTDGPTLRVHNFGLSGAPEALRSLHARLQPLLLFAVDGSDGIDADDPRWRVFLATQTPPGAAAAPALCGMLTAFRFWAPVESMRLRVAQVMVFTPCQKQGVGSALVAAAGAYAAAEGALDVTYEDPSEDMQTLRELLDVRRAAQCSWVKEALAAAVASMRESEWQKPAALPPAVAERMKNELQISKVQAVKVWEGLLWSLDDEEMEGAGQEALKRGVRTRLARMLQDGGPDEAGKGPCIPKVMLEGATVADFIMAPGVEGGTRVAMEAGAEAGKDDAIAEAVEVALEGRLQQLDAIADRMEPSDQGA